MDRIPDGHQYSNLASKAEIDPVAQNPLKKDVFDSILELLRSIFKQHFSNTLPQRTAEVYRKTIDLYAGRLHG